MEKGGIRPTILPEGRVIRLRVWLKPLLAHIVGKRDKTLISA